jgi:hypothetical protein
MKRYTEQQARAARRLHQPAQKRFAALQKTGNIGVERNGTQYGMQMRNGRREIKKAT